MLRMRLNICLNPQPNRSTTLHYRLHPHLRYHRSLSTIMSLLHSKPLNTNPRLRESLSQRNESRPRKANKAVQRNRDHADNTRLCLFHLLTFIGNSGRATRSGQ
ncbi:hypothetical protein CRG98_007315 [Punica granatum]|uniref:Uncharacterized protein n=1 Tax=Punica granatum TaxID=22663 RepID=A0A2I0KV00_PUNGR|nr:hypothetical protein CRG98_007315 [Punica granatum]